LEALERAICRLGEDEALARSFVELDSLLTIIHRRVLYELPYFRARVTQGCVTTLTSGGAYIIQVELQIKHHGRIIIA
jgi:hypothetical protein